MRFGYSQFPGQAGVMNGGHGGRAGTAVVTGNEHNLRAGLCHAAGDRADSGLRNQLNADARMPVGIF